MAADYDVPVDLNSVAIFVVGATPSGLKAGCLPPAPASAQWLYFPSSTTRVTLDAIVSISLGTASFFAALGANSEYILFQFSFDSVEEVFWQHKPMK